MATKPYISVLERNMENPEYRRQMEEAQALEGSYPVEELLAMGAGKAARAVAGAARDAGRSVYNAADMAMRPRVENKLIEPLLGSAKRRLAESEEKYAQRFIRDPKELEDIIKSGYVRAEPGAASQRKFFSKTAPDNPDAVWDAAKAGNQRSIRVPLDKVPEGRAVRKKDVQLQNQETGEYEPFRKGGLVRARNTGFKGYGKARKK